MRLRTLIVFLLVAPPAWAHAPGAPPSFVFFEPKGAGTVAQNDQAQVTWLDDDSDPRVMIGLFALRGPIPPFPLTAASDAIPGGEPITSAEVAMADLSNKATWNTAGIGPGCYQPFARLKDPDGTYLNVAGGKIVVPGSGNVPPSIWITNLPTDGVGLDGTFRIHFQVVDPDDGTRVTLKYGEGVVPASLVTITEDLPMKIGTSDSSVALDVKGLKKGLYAIYASVKSPDGTLCETYWPRTLAVTGGPYAGPDAGAPDGGPRDAETPRSTPDVGPRPYSPDVAVPETGCACDAGGGGVVGVLLAVVFLAPLRAGATSRSDSGRQRAPA